MNLYFLRVFAPILGNAAIFFRLPGFFGVTNHEAVLFWSISGCFRDPLFTPGWSAYQYQSAKASGNHTKVRKETLSHARAMKFMAIRSAEENFRRFEEFGEPNTEATGGISTT